MNKTDLKKQVIDNISMITHEVKTPVNLIYSTAKIADMRIRSDSISQNDLEKYFQNIINNCNKINLMLNNIMSINSINKSDYELIDINYFAKEFSKCLAEFEEVYNFKFNLDTETEIEKINIPVNTTERILLNLINNAVKYNSKTSKIISLKIYDKDDFLYFSVKDNGDGISEENLPRITEKFFRASNTSVGGIGLGLSMVKDLVSEMGGELKITSKLKKGTEVTFSVPVNNKDRMFMLKSNDFDYIPSKSYFAIELATLNTNE